MEQDCLNISVNELLNPDNQRVFYLLGAEHDTEESLGGERFLVHTSGDIEVGDAGDGIGGYGDRGVEEEDGELVETVISIEGENHVEIRKGGEREEEEVCILCREKTDDIATHLSKECNIVLTPAKNGSIKCYGCRVEYGSSAGIRSHWIENSRCRWSYHNRCSPSDSRCSARENSRCSITELGRLSNRKRSNCHTDNHRTSTRKAQVPLIPLNLDLYQIRRFTCSFCHQNFKLQVEHFQKHLIKCMNEKFFITEYLPGEDEHPSAPVLHIGGDCVTCPVCKEDFSPMEDSLLNHIIVHHALKALNDNVEHAIREHCRDENPRPAVFSMNKDYVSRLKDPGSVVVKVRDEDLDDPDEESSNATLCLTILPPPAVEANSIENPLEHPKQENEFLFQCIFCSYSFSATKSICNLHLESCVSEHNIDVTMFGWNACPVCEMLFSASHSKKQDDPFLKHITEKHCLIKRVY